MKNSVAYFMLFLLFIKGSAYAQIPEKEVSIPINQKSNYICDSLFNLYTGYWQDWWEHTLKIKGPIPGKVQPAHFVLPYSDLELLDSLGNKGLLPDSVEAYFAFTSEKDYKTNQLTAIILLNDSASFNKSTRRWRTWSKDHIKGQQPVGFKIRFADLDSMYRLLEDPTNHVKSMTGYLVFHSKSDKNLNKISVVFRPTFKGKQKKVKNDKISCGQSTNSTLEKRKGSSFINIDFTNPCPPCDTSG